ncbi:MAG: Hsp20/alpha crystallin family protein [Acidobacteria bacterium]|nr:MAG: Hsp20/alpha crystallin family protein [Acidobacteriota bacterium]
MLSTALTRRTPTTTPFFGGRDPFVGLMDSFLRDWPSLSTFFDGGTYERGWMPAVDIRETDDAFIATAELPGMDKKDIEVTVDGNVLTLRGERKLEDAQKDNGYRRIERAYGTFQRSFALPTGVDSTKVSAQFKDGLLTLTIPKAEDAKPRTIKVS